MYVCTYCAKLVGLVVMINMHPKVVTRHRLVLVGLFVTLSHYLLRSACVLDLKTLTSSVPEL